MIVTAKLKYLRIAPRKVRLVVNLIKNKPVEEAQTILNFTVNRSAKPVLKLLNSAIANAKNNFQLDEKNLYISKIFVDEGPKLKRWHAQSRGRAAQIQKKSSHIFLELAEIKESKKKIKKKKTVEKPEVKKEKAEEPEIKREEAKEEELLTKKEKPKVKLKRKIPLPKIGQGMKRIFKRKAF